MKPIYFLLLIILNLNFVNAQDAGIKFEESNWEQILSKAKKENKLIFLDAYAEWCGPCKWMAKNTFTDNAVAEYYNSHFINAKIDMEKGEGIELAKKYNVRAYPSLLYIAADGSLAHRTCGAANPEAFIAMGQTAMDNNSNMSSYDKKYSSGERNAEFIYGYARALQHACLPPGEMVAEYLSAQSDDQLIKEENWKLIKDFLTDYDSKPFKYLMVNKEKFASAFGRDEVDEKIFSVYQTALFTYEAKNDRKGLEELKSNIRASGNPDAEKIILFAELKGYERKKQWNEYAVTAERYAKEYAWDDPNMLNNIAWIFYEQAEDKNQLQNAATWAQRSMELEETYYNTDTYAALQFKFGNKEEARKAAEKAIKLAKDNGEESGETEELLRKINAMK